jgi:hypothetical protein
MATYRVLSWRGIPAQVRVRDDAGHRVSRALPDRFQKDIDGIAMRDGITDSEAYLAGWTWSADMEQPGSADDVATAVVEELVAAWDSNRKSIDGSSS